MCGTTTHLAAVQQSDSDIALLVDKAMVHTADADVAAICALVATARPDAELAAKRYIVAQQSLCFRLIRTPGTLFPTTWICGSIWIIR